MKLKEDVLPAVAVGTLAGTAFYVLGNVVGTAITTDIGITAGALAAIGFAGGFVKELF